jgi:hypothetical protein
MKKSIAVLIIASLFTSCNQKNKDTTDNISTQKFRYDESQKKTNDFYDDAEPFVLEGSRIINVAGEISNPGEINIKQMPMHSLIVKETFIDGDSNKFIGAYKYDGYSLYDILNEYKLKKKNEDSFKPIIDLYVIVENESGEKTILSWGELYYPVNRYNIIIATRVTRIVPSKSKELWPLPEKTKLIVSYDLLTERNISNPVKISIVSYDIELKVQKRLKPLYSPEITIFNGNKKIRTINTIPENFKEIEYEAVFYGRGRGIHSTLPFNGYLLKEILKSDFSFSQENIQNGIIVIAAEDGYRAVFTFSEIFNRNDQSEVLLIPDPSNIEDGGAYKLFPSCDFFSDRAIKAINGICFETCNL